MEQVRTVVLFQGDHLRREYRNLLSQVGLARIELEVSNAGPSLEDPVLEQITSLRPDIFLVDLLKHPEHTLALFRQLRELAPQTPILAFGSQPPAEFLIEALRLGVRELLPKPVSATQLAAAYHRVFRNTQSARSKLAPAMTLSFLNSRGGSGSTTIMVNFGFCLAQITGGRVLLLDLNLPIGDLAPYLGLKEYRSLCASEASPWEPAQVDQCITHSCGIDVLSLVQSESPKTRQGIPNVKALLYYLRTQYDYLLIDLPNAIDDSVVSALDVAELVFLVSKCDLPSLRNDQRYLQVLSRLGYPLSKVKLLMNRVGKQDLTGPEIHRILSFEVFWQLPSDFRSVIESIQQGKPLALHASTSPLSDSFYELVTEVLGTSDLNRLLPSVNAETVDAKKAQAAAVSRNPLTVSRLKPLRS